MQAADVRQQTGFLKCVCVSARRVFDVLYPLKPRSRWPHEVWPKARTSRVAHMHKLHRRLLISM
jgi:hypothetical protein